MLHGDTLIIIQSYLTHQKFMNIMSETEKPLDKAGPLTGVHLVIFNFLEVLFPANVYHDLKLQEKLLF